MPKPIKSLELHYPMIQILIIYDGKYLILCILFNGTPCSLVGAYFANIVEFKQDGIIVNGTCRFIFKWRFRSVALIID